jgi:hypothetical protein
MSYKNWENKNTKVFWSTKLLSSGSNFFVSFIVYNYTLLHKGRKKILQKTQNYVRITEI